ASVEPKGEFRERIADALNGVQAAARVTAFNRRGLASVLERRAPAALAGQERVRLVLAFNEARQRLFMCEIEQRRARLKWCALDVLEKERPWLISLDRETSSAAAKVDQASMSREVLAASCEEGLKLLPRSEGLWVLGYAALHGHTQRDLSSCQVASL